MSKEWKIRAVQEEDLTVYAKKLQSIVNRMETDGFSFTVDGPGTAASPVIINEKLTFISLITGSRDKTVKLVVREEE